MYEIAGCIDVVEAVYFYFDLHRPVPNLRNDRSRADGMLAFRLFGLLDERRGLLPDQIGKSPSKT